MKKSKTYDMKLHDWIVSNAKTCFFGVKIPGKINQKQLSGFFSSPEKTREKNPGKMPKKNDIVFLSIYFFGLKIQG